MSTAPIPDRSGFDFTGRIRALCSDVAIRLPQMTHIDMTRVAVSFCQTRKRVPHGLYAALTPMRFEDGSRFTIRYGQRYTCQRIYNEAGREFLYILSFYLPRFLDVPLCEKLTTVFHELWHIHPAFNGDIRRYRGRCYVHSNSQKKYDSHMQRFVDQWLASSPPHYLYEFLRFNFNQLQQRHGHIHGTKIAHPKLLPTDIKTH